ncbi:MAG: hypothetical protein M1556_01440 [Candidatus Thermoplasmatota archaeon]|jgi:hypothetical protein|nr:hypothetical protein [Candidatus Thermoplasmatota archaeon]MCL6002299.1 hypothetical protein [Candidatus Thermoplasmatota archaeon]
MVERNGTLICDKCGKAVEKIYAVALGNIMKIELCDDCERDLELFVIDFIHGVKE